MDNKYKTALSFVLSMNLAEIENECRKRKLRITKDRHSMESRLVKAITKEPNNNPI